VREPLLALTAALEDPLAGISPSILAIPKKQGGSLFRIHRDLRFSRDKRPYKTAAALQFRHERGRDAHAPGYYLHLEPGLVFAGAGMWRPPRPELNAIRTAIDEDLVAWRRVRDQLESAGWRLDGDALRGMPRGWPAAHPAAEDLKRTDIVVTYDLSEDEACAPGFPGRFVELCRGAAPLLAFQCEALEIPW
jgi:uncharacterized protein (TIGR02453 family)